MDLSFAGIRIRQARMDRGWSQEGLCRGICAVSYLSKIEQGKVSAGGDILRLLFERLDVRWYGDEAHVQQSARLSEQFYEMLFLAYDGRAFEHMRAAFIAHQELLFNGPYGLDGLLMAQFLAEENARAPLDPQWEPFLNRKQLALQRILQQRMTEAIGLWPCAYTYMEAGSAAYISGDNYSTALEYLQKAYDLAADGGYVHMMMRSRTLMGNCYSNLLDYVQMQSHYAVALRLARALGDSQEQQSIEYNTASTALELGNITYAYDYFSSLEDPSPMALHKLAICCEKLGKRREAFDALARIQTADEPLFDGTLLEGMCDLVRFRLEHPDYLQHEAYGQMLLECFASCRASLPIGYAVFHLPWVLEWYTAARQYKQAFELLREFPIRLPVNPADGGGVH